MTPRLYWWCDVCEIALREDEAVRVPLPAEQGCAGATTLYRYECDCGAELDEYRQRESSAYRIVAKYREKQS